MISVTCDYCGEPAKLIDSVELYGKSYGMMYMCWPCDAYVGTHKDSPDHTPLGRLANEELRTWKKKAHAAFDPLWKRKMARDNCSQKEARNAGYAWLAKQLDIPVKDCHIGRFDEEQCIRVTEVCRRG